MLLIIGCAATPNLETSDYGRQLECIEQYPYGYQGDCYIKKTLNDPNYSQTLAFLEDKRPKSFTAWERLLIDNKKLIADINSGKLNWQNANSWVNPSGSTTISLDSIAVGDGRYLCMAFSQKGNDIATENDNYFRIWAIGDLKIEATYIK